MWKGRGELMLGGGGVVSVVCGGGGGDCLAYDGFVEVGGVLLKMGTGGMRRERDSGTVKGEAETYGTRLRRKSRRREVNMMERLYYKTDTALTVFCRKLRLDKSKQCGERIVQFSSF